MCGTRVHIRAAWAHLGRIKSATPAGSQGSSPQASENMTCCLRRALFQRATGSFSRRERKSNHASQTFYSVAKLCSTLCDPWTAPLSFTVSWSLLKFMSIESVMLSSHLILCHPVLLLPSIFPSIRVFSNESALHIRWPKYCFIIWYHTFCCVEQGMSCSRN